MHGTHERAKAKQFNSAAVALTLGVLYGVSVTCNAADTVLVQRDTQISEARATPYAVVKTPDGGYLVAGSGGITDNSGWAVQPDTNGKRRWEFLDTQAATPELRRHARGRLNGAVALDNGRSLLCGEKDHVDEEPQRNSSGRVVIVDSDGHAEARDVYANGNPQGLFTAIDLCFAWGDGVAMLGTNGAGSGWLVRLDSKGAIVWEKEPHFARPLDAIETPDHGLLVLSTGALAHGTSAQLDRLDAHGNSVLTRQVDGGERAKFIRPWSGGSPISIVTVAGSLETRLIRVDLKFRDLGAPIVLDSFYAYQSYFLADHKTIATFGSVKDSGDTAAVGWITASNKLNILQLEPPHASFFIYDSVPAGDNEFAIVRCIHFRPFLGWISFAK